MYTVGDNRVNSYNNCKKEDLLEYFEPEFKMHRLVAYVYDNVAYLICGKTGGMLEVSIKLYNDIKKHHFNNDIRFKMVQRGLAKCNESRDAFDIQEHNTCNPNFFIIDLTNACNLNCIYCFRNYSPNEIFTINDEQLLQICSYIYQFALNRGMKRISIQPWGGEPLLAFDKIERIYDYFKNKDLKVNITIETNGTLITDDIARKCVDHHYNIGISIDGYESIQNLQRPMKNNDSSFKKVVDGLFCLENAGYKNTGVICVMTSRNCNDIGQIIFFLSKELGIKYLKINPIKANSNVSDLSLSEEQIHNALNQIIDVLESLYLEGIVVFENNIYQKFINLIYCDRRNICQSRGCMGGKSMISFDGNGNIFPCEMTDFKSERLGSIYSGDSLDGMIQKAMINNRYYYNRETSHCDYCPWYIFCRGGCKTAAKYLHGDFLKIDEVECIINKWLYPKLLDMYNERSGIILEYIKKYENERIIRFE